MAKGVNKAIIIGHLGQDPEVRYMPNSTAVAQMSIATTEVWTDKQTGEKKESTEWHRVVIYQRLAEIAGEYLRKGSKVYIEGRLRTRKWQDQQGIERYTTEIVCSDMQMLDSLQSSNGQAFASAQSTGQQRGMTGNQGNQQAPRRQPPPQGYSGVMPGQRNANNQPPPPPIDFDDDIPF